MAASENVPLEERKVRINVNGIGRFIPALHAEWIFPREWVSYAPPPCSEDVENVQGAKDTWIQRTELVIDDLMSLLRAPYHVFWSQVCFDKDVHKFLGRLLKRLPHSHDRLSTHPVNEIQAIIASVMTHSFYVFLRMSTCKESPSDFMSPSFFGKIVYNDFLFDVPKILDICSLYLTGNRQLVSKMVHNLITHQPKYLDDLRSCGATTVDASEAISSKIELHFQSRKGLETKDFEDLILCGADLACSISSLFEACSKASEAFHAANSEFTVKMAGFYHNCLSVAHSKIVQNWAEENVSQETALFLQSRILLAKLNILKLVRVTVMHNVIAPVIDGTTPGEDELEELLHLYSGYLSEASFFSDYLSSYPLDDDLDIFKLRGLQIDPMRVEYLKDGIFHIDPSPKRKSRPSDVVPPKTISNGAAAMVPAAASIDSVQFASLVAQVRDLFPTLGEGFLTECLPYFDSDPEKVINALLEDNLPPHLAEMDRAMTKRVQQPLMQMAEPVIVPSEAYDAAHDEALEGFEVSRLHRGKKKLAKNANALLDDKRDLESMRDRFAVLGIVKDEVYLGPDDVEYDDEYDDTYDENARGEIEPDALEIEREFVLPRALGGGHVTNRKKYGLDEGEDDDEDEGGENGVGQNLDFARNPEEIRQEAERKRQAKMALSGGSKRPINHNRDVVGNPKGQGQEKQTLINRARKNTNKGKHHRAMADRKQAKGMF